MKQVLMHIVRIIGYTLVNFVAFFLLIIGLMYFYGDAMGVFFFYFPLYTGVSIAVGILFNWIHVALTRRGWPAYSAVGINILLSITVFTIFLFLVIL